MSLIPLDSVRIAEYVTECIKPFSNDGVTSQQLTGIGIKAIQNDLLNNEKSIDIFEMIIAKEIAQSVIINILKGGK